LRAGWPKAGEKGDPFPPKNPKKNPPGAKTKKPLKKKRGETTEKGGKSTLFRRRLKKTGGLRA